MDSPKRRGPRTPPQRPGANSRNTPAQYTPCLPAPMLVWAVVTGTGYGLLLLVAVLGMAGFFDHVELVTVPPVAEVAHHE